MAVEETGREGDAPNRASVAEWMFTVGSELLVILA
jgi:hypothetical protein